MFNNISVIRDKFGYAAVYDTENDATQCVNFGNREVDRNFADRVQTQMVKMGYTPSTYKNETTFTKRVR